MGQDNSPTPAEFPDSLKQTFTIKERKRFSNSHKVRNLIKTKLHIFYWMMRQSMYLCHAFADTIPFMQKTRYDV